MRRGVADGSADLGTIDDLGVVEGGARLGRSATARRPSCSLPTVVAVVATIIAAASLTMVAFHVTFEEAFAVVPRWASRQPRPPPATRPSTTTTMPSALQRYRRTGTTWILKTSSTPTPVPRRRMTSTSDAHPASVPSSYRTTTRTNGTPHATSRHGTPHPPASPTPSPTPSPMPNTIRSSVPGLTPSPRPNPARPRTSTRRTPSPAPNPSPSPTPAPTLKPKASTGQRQASSGITVAITPSCPVLNATAGRVARSFPDVVRGLYVSFCRASTLGDQYDMICQSRDKQYALLAFVVDQRINSLAMYNLNTVFRDSSLTATLSEFMTAANACGVSEFNGIIGDGGFSTDRDALYGYQTNPNYSSTRFNGLITEFEFWNPSGETEASAFARYLSDIKALRGTASIPGAANGTRLKVGTYLGWLTNAPPNQTVAAAEIANNVDRVYLHAYVSNPVNAFSYMNNRLQSFATAGVPLEIIPIYSGEGKWYCDGCTYPTTPCTPGVNCFSGDWFAAHGLAPAESAFNSSYTAWSHSAHPALNWVGYQYFAYQYLGHYVQ